ncbi:hypothetical protein [Pseudomonas chlororaphis]|uniref:hypothetical protein n=1 Tax=Pseudomonas chlororaphis TaxID=587753 RepID=UPI0006A62207|nr:hypothetical protein [Pseudomonas chlororaphis]
MLPYIATYLLIAAILAVIDRFTDKPLFIRTHSKQFPWKLNYSIRYWSAQEYWAALTIGSIAALLLLLFWHVVGGSISKSAALAILIAICFSSSVLSIRHFKLVEKFKAHAWWMTVLTALITVGLGLAANAFADAFIVNLTRVDAAQFPVAQKALTTLILVFSWAFIATLIISVVVGIVSFTMAITTPTFRETIKRDYLAASHRKHYSPGFEFHHRSRMLYAVFIGSAYTVIIAWGLWEQVLKHTDEILQETMVWTSFHLHPRDCSIPGRPHDTWAALVNDNRAVVATPSKEGYTFETLPCEIQSTQAIESATLERLKQDDYF